MSAPNPSVAPPAAPHRGCGAACFQALVILFVLAGATIAAMLLGPPMIAEFAKFHVRKVADQILKQNIDERFREHVGKIVGTNGNILEVAVKEGEEVFDRRTELIVAGFKVPFFDTEVTLKTRATFRYHIKLDGVWRLREEGPPNQRSLVVVAPGLEPTLPVAFDSRAMESALKGYWFSKYHQDLSLEELRKGLTDKLEERARSGESIDSVREASRRSVGLFVKNWLVTEEEWRARGLHDIKVVFPDEEQKDTTGLPPTVELDVQPPQASGSSPQNPSPNVAST